MSRHLHPVPPERGGGRPEPDATRDADTVLADSILEALAPSVPGPGRAMRIVLAVVAVVLLALSIPWLFGADPIGLLGDASDSHLTRDGALGLAVAIAGGLTAWRPRYAVAAAMVAGAVLITQITAAVVDGHLRRVSFLVELGHGLTALVTLLIVIAGRPAKPIRKQRPAAVRLVGREPESG